MKGVKLRIFLKDRGVREQGKLKHVMSFASARRLADLAAEIRTETTVKTALDLADEIQTEPRPADVRQSGAAPEGGREPGAVQPDVGLCWGGPGQVADGVFPGGDDSGESTVHSCLGVPDCVWRWPWIMVRAASFALRAIAAGDQPSK